MKILFMYYVPSGGVETLNRQRAAALKAKQVECHFIYFKKTRDLINDHQTTTFITDNDMEIKKIIADNQYDAIVVTSDYPTLPKLRKFGFSGITILEIQGFGPKDTARKELTKAVPFVKNYANGLLNPRTPHIAELFKELYPQVPTFQFNNCFDINQFHYQPTSRSTEPIVAWIGRIEDNKNWREFLHIGARLISLLPTIKLYMFEDHTLAIPKEREEFEQLIVSLGLVNHLTIHSNVPNEQMQKYYSEIGDSGGFLCATSKVEGAPYAILEAMSCKCPILSTDSDGVRSAIIDNQTGIYYELGNINDAIEKSKQYFIDKEKRENIREQALAHAKKDFSPEAYSNNFIQMIHTLKGNSN